MSPLQFTLFFAALLVGYVLVHLRMVRFEAHLRELGRLRRIDEVLVALDARVEQLGGGGGQEALDRLAAKLEQLHVDLQDLQKVTKGSAESSVTIPSAPPMRAAHGEDAGGGAPASRIVAVIESRLLELGYRNIRLLGDLEGVELSDEVEVQVEAQRNGMPVKGRVITRNGSVSDINIQTVAQSFP